MNKRTEIIENQKPKRVPLGRRNVLKVKGLQDESNFQYRWLNDIGDRLQQSIEGGYEFVDKAGLEAGDRTVETARGTESIMKKGVGMGITAYLMRIPREFYDRDQMEKQLLVDAMEADVRKPKVDGAYGKVEIEQKSTA